MMEFLGILGGSARFRILLKEPAGGSSVCNNMKKKKKKDQGPRGSGGLREGEELVRSTCKHADATPPPYHAVAAGIMVACGRLCGVGCQVWIRSEGEVVEGHQWGFLLGVGGS